MGKGLEQGIDLSIIRYILASLSIKLYPIRYAD